MSVFPKEKKVTTQTFKVTKTLKNERISDLNDLTLRRITPVKDNDTRREKNSSVLIECYVRRMVLKRDHIRGATACQFHKCFRSISGAA